MGGGGKTHYLFCLVLCTNGSLGCRRDSVRASKLRGLLRRALVKCLERAKRLSRQNLRLRGGRENARCKTSQIEESRSRNPVMFSTKNLKLRFPSVQSSISFWLFCSPLEKQILWCTHAPNNPSWPNSAQRPTLIAKR